MQRLRWLALTIAAIFAIFVGADSTTAFAASESQNYAMSLQRQIQNQLADTHGGTQISPNEVAYDGGKVIVVFPDASGSVPTAQSLRPGDIVSWHGCPVGASQTWYCFFADQNYAGRMLEFQDCSPSGTKQSFASWDFTNQTSSWVNTYGLVDPVQASVGTWNGGTSLWVEPPNDASPYVGNANNDKAQWFDAYC
jgi:hypothetical protein